jgi:hypothetical protein
VLFVIPDPPIDVIDPNELDLWCEQWLSLAMKNSRGLVKQVITGNNGEVRALDFWLDSDAVHFKLTANYDEVLAMHTDAYLAEKTYFQFKKLKAQSLDS